MSLRSVWNADVSLAPKKEPAEEMLPADGNLAARYAGRLRHVSTRAAGGDDTAIAEHAEDGRDGRRVRAQGATKAVGENERAPARVGRWAEAPCAL